jgi:hypothetical protein
MLRSLKDLERYNVSATDGDIGSVADFLLDDERWAIRYLVVKTGSFFNERRVLVSPIFFREVDWSATRFHVALTMDKVKNSPSVDTNKPVSRQNERDYYGYFGYPYYWGSSGMWGTGNFPGTLLAREWYNPSADCTDEPGDAHLRSVQEVRGYHIQGSDESIGHVDDFIVDDLTWAIRYLVVDTSNWWVSKKVLIAPPWATRVSWGERNVYVDMPRQAIKDSPEWNAYAAVNREYETRLYDYYGRPVYWEGGVGSEVAPAARHAHGP